MKILAFAQSPSGAGLQLICAAGVAGCLVPNPNGGADANQTGSTSSDTTTIGPTDESGQDAGETPTTTSTTESSSSLDPSAGSEGSTRGENPTSTSGGATGPGPETTEGSGTSTGDSAAGLPNGFVCDTNEECLSGRCFLLGPVVVGLCSECASDADCEWGCAPFGLSGFPDQARCNNGTLGRACETSAACDGGLVCALGLEITGVGEFRGCSECDEDSDCGTGLCTPRLGIAQSVAYRECVDVGTLPLGSYCDPSTSGAAACAASFCAETTISGLSSGLGLCSHCSNDAVPNEGCTTGLTCAAPEATIEGGRVAGTCN